MHHLCLCSFFALECCPERAGPRCRLAGSTVTFVTPGTHPESVYASLNPTWHPHSHSHTLRVLRPLPLPSWKAYKRLCLVGSSFYRRRLPPPGNSPAPHLSYGFCLLSPFQQHCSLSCLPFPAPLTSLLSWTTPSARAFSSASALHRSPPECHITPVLCHTSWPHFSEGLTCAFPTQPTKSNHSGASLLGMLLPVSMLSTPGWLFITHLTCW